MSTVDYIFDQQNPRLLRAIELFVVLVALHVSRSRVKVSGTRASRPQIGTNLVRMLAAMKTLDQLETDSIP
jgi:hypothetical protein